MRRFDVQQPYWVLEALAFSLGFALRLGMLHNYAPWWSYDFSDHWKHAGWYAQHFALPPFGLSRTDHHPPLYYFLLGSLRRTGLTPQGAQTFSVCLSVLRLGVAWIGFRRFLPRPAAWVALWLAAVLPASVHLDAMVTNEPLLNLECALLLLWGATLLRSPRVSGLSGFGVLLGLTLLTKASALTITGAFIACVTAKACWDRSSTRALLVGGALCVGIAVLLGSISWAHNHASVGHYIAAPVKDAELPPQIREKPIYRRRPPIYFVGWTTEIYDSPYCLADFDPTPRFFPQLVASTFVDYYNYNYAPRPKTSPLQGCYRPLEQSVLTASRVSVAGGTVLALLAAIAWCAAWVRVLRAPRKYDEGFLLLVPLFATLGQLYFATAMPLDGLGMVKGVYMQFAALPLCGLVGLGAWWIGTTRMRLLAPLVWAAIAAVTGYSIWCRLL